MSPSVTSDRVKMRRQRKEVRVAAEFGEAWPFELDLVDDAAYAAQRPPVLVLLAVLCVALLLRRRLVDAKGPQELVHCGRLKSDRLSYT
jgi:hypothetical protein